VAGDIAGTAAQHAGDAERTRVRAEQQDAEQEADIADPGDQERLERGNRAPPAGPGSVR